MRVLVVDDDEAGRHLAASILGSVGHRVETAVDGVDALEKARAEPPDAVLSDILMPRMDGYQLAREWKADPVLCQVPIIFYTASYTDPADEKFALDLGVDGFLSKPVDAEVLLGMVAEVAQRGERLVPRRPSTADETAVLREYNERLVHKLEEKVADLERANVMLESTMQALGEEVEVKRGLIGELNAEVAERRLREEELRSERDFTARVIDTAHVFILGLDRESRIRLFSPGAERISGWPASDVLGTPYFERFVPEELREMRRAEVSRLLETGTTTRYVGAIETREGEQRVLEWSGTVSVDADGRPDGVLMFGIDVTDRVSAAAVERAMARIDLAVLLDRPESEVLDVACERLVAEFGFLLAFVVRREEGGSGLALHALAGPLAGHFEDLAHGVAPDTVCPVHAAMDADALTVVTADDVRVAEGAAELSRFGAESAAAVPLRAHGVTIGAIGLVGRRAGAFDGFRGEMLRRLADRVAIGLLVAEGRRQVALQSAALESAGNGIVIATVDGRVSWVNRAFTALTGFTAAEVRGRDLFAEPEGEASLYREPLYREAWETVSSGSTWRGEFANTRKDGAVYLEDVTIAPVPDERGRIGHVVIVKQDLTERRELEQLKADFTAVVSHELRTPLTSVIGYADLLAKSAADTLVPPADTALSKLRENAARMHDLVERLLEVTQMEAEGVRLELAECDLPGLVAESLSDLPTTNRHTFTVESADAPPAVVCDAPKLRRALGNLLDNAVKYSPDGGEVRIEVSSAQDGVVISIADQGEGMPPERVPALFERFTQLDMSSTRRFGGMGIGLFVAYNIVRAHGGTIYASSEPGEGSVFTVRLPVAGPGSEG